MRAVSTTGVEVVLDARILSVFSSKFHAAAAHKDQDVEQDRLDDELLTSPA